MRVLVTGATGFVGVHLVRRLEALGHEVGGTGLAQPSGEAPGYEVDLTEPTSVAAAVDDFAPDAIVHLAGASHVGGSWGAMGSYHRINVLGTEYVLDAAAGRPVLMASSAEVYGAVPEAEQPIAEDRVPDPSSPYALTKAAAERLVLRAGGVVARLFNLVGPGQSTTFALPTFASQLDAIQRGQRPPVLEVGNLEAKRDFVHVRDGVAGLACLLERGMPGTTYQVATGKASSIREVLQRLIAVSGVEASIKVDPARLRPVDVPLLVGEASRIRALGWRPERTIDTAVADLWAATTSATGSGAGL